MISKVKSALEVQEDVDVDSDRECNEISKYIATSLGLGLKIAQIKGELKEMGFPKAKIDAVIEKLK